MALYLPDHDAAFLHVPKCAGSWLKSILKATARHVEAGSGGDYYAHSRRPDPRPKFVFAFVRRPQTWYESWWRFEMDRNWPERAGGGKWHYARCLDFARECRDFNDWMRAVMDDEPAYVTRLYEWYCGPEGSKDVDFIGKIENLIPDAIKALDLAGVKPDSSIFDTPPENASKTPRPEWDGATLRRMLTLEAATIRRFGW
jgi:hypothetical protein